SQKSSLQGFLLVVECDRGRILGAANCSNNGILGATVNSSDLIGQCLLDLVHPRDADLVRQELTVPDLPSLQQQQQQRQGFSTDRLGSCGLRRRFFCRFRHPGGSAAGGGLLGVASKRRG
uniref:PAS domain-containing protein n=1 Tax=Macrostomum lignano TaxID=282301 RepID=A0A1I8I2S3_9PLAT